MLANAQAVALGLVESVPRTPDPEADEQRMADNKKSAIRPAWAQVEKRIIGLGRDHLVTLTSRENIEDGERFRELVHACLKGTLL